jgi:hypothetical protein
MAGRLHLLTVLRTAAVFVAAVTLSACGWERAAEPSGQRVDDRVHGITVDLPPEWQRSTVNLTPGLGDPREVLSVATFPLHYRQTGCSQFPSSALEALGPADALVTVQERGLDPRSAWSDFPPRPAHFGPKLGGPSEASACVPSAHFTDHWFRFTDGDRHFHVLVVFGQLAPGEVRREAWHILDGVKIDPGTRPSWKASG